MYWTVFYIKENKKRNLINALSEVVHIYKAARFKIITLYGDKEFESIRDYITDILKVKLNCITPSTYIPKVENNNKVIQEQVRAGFHALPFSVIPHVITKYLVMESAQKLNYFYHVEEYQNITDPG